MIGMRGCNGCKGCGAALPCSLSLAADNFCLPRLPHIFAGALCAILVLGAHQFVSCSPTLGAFSQALRCKPVFPKALYRGLPGKSGLMIHARHMAYPVLPSGAQFSN